MTTKEKITEEALTLFARKGYKGTSVKNIADAVGIKDASLEMFETPKKHLNLYVIKDNEHIIDESILKQSIINLLKKKITKYGMPSKIIFVDQFPKTRVGKIDHKAFKDED